MLTHKPQPLHGWAVDTKSHRLAAALMGFLFDEQDSESHIEGIEWWSIRATEGRWKENGRRKMEACKKAHAAGKHRMGNADERDISDEDYTMCRLLVAMGIGVTLLVGAYHIGIALIDAFEGALRWCVIHGANPFGWS